MALKYDSIDEILTKYLPHDELKEVNRILYGHQHDERLVFCEQEQNLAWKFFGFYFFFRYLGAEKDSNYDIEKYCFASSNKDSISRIVKVCF